MHFHDGSGDRGRMDRRKRWLMRILWTFLPYLPKALRQRLALGIFAAPEPLPKEIQFKKAESYSEIEQAFRIIAQELPGHDPVSKYHALPTTTILIAKWKNEVIGTVSVVVDSAFGLPMDGHWNLSSLRKNSTRIAEISSLSIKSEYRAKRGHLLLPLCRFTHEFARNNLAVDALVVATRPNAAYFFQDIFQFQPLAANRALTTVGLYSALGPVPEKCETTGPTYSAALLEYFFHHQVDVLRQLSPQERVTLANVYFIDAYRSVLGLSHAIQELRGRKHPRFEVLCNGRIAHRPSDTVLRATVLEVSRNGMKVHFHQPIDHLKLDDTVHVTVELAPQKQVLIRTEAAWLINQFDHAGLRIVGDAPTEWGRFIDCLEADIGRRAA